MDSSFNPVFLHRVQNDLMDWSIEHNVVVPALCRFPTLVSPPEVRLGHAVDNVVELECPTCADLYGHIKERRERLTRLAA